MPFYGSGLVSGWHVLSLCIRGTGDYSRESYELLLIRQIYLSALCRVLVRCASINQHCWCGGADVSATFLSVQVRAFSTK